MKTKVFLYHLLLLLKCNFLSTKIVNNPRNKGVKFSNTRYILLWTKSIYSPFNNFQYGNIGFKKRLCPYTNCYSTENRTLFRDYRKFHAVLFYGPDVLKMSTAQLPQRRSPFQKYVFAALESPVNYEICHDHFNNFFNWTWTYKLNSDLILGYIAIRDRNGTIIGPNKDVKWLKLREMDNVTNELKEKLKSKSKLAAWFISNCEARSGRNAYYKELKKELRHYRLEVDVFGKCGKLKCSIDNIHKCFKMLEKDYYFYFAFENSFAEDYVTEKLMHALQHNTVPVVFGGADYSRFMPKGIYLDARKLGPKRLANIMNHLYNTPDIYYEMFRWKNHYSYYSRLQNVETDDYCNLCAVLNDEGRMIKKTGYKDFISWWGSPRCTKI